MINDTTRLVGIWVCAVGATLTAIFVVAILRRMK